MRLDMRVSQDFPSLFVIRNVEQYRKSQSRPSSD